MRLIGVEASRRTSPQFHSGSCAIVTSMVGSGETFEARAARRRSWMVRLCRLGEGSSDDLSAFTTPEERLKMMWPLAIEAWRLSGGSLPTYERGQAPVRLLRDAHRQGNAGS